MTANNRDNPLDLEKLKIHERLTGMEAGDKLFRAELRDLLQQISLRTANLELMIHGDTKDKDKKVRDGINRRVDYLEDVNDKVETGLEKKKDRIYKISVGSITLALGSAIVWIFDVIRHAFINK